jgi:hypothetical protein
METTNTRLQLTGICFTMMTINLFFTPISFFCDAAILQPQFFREGNFPVASYPVSLPFRYAANKVN